MKRMKNKGKGVAHAKVILIGEHAVVYGQPGIALPFLPLELIATVESNEKDELHAEFFSGFMDQLPDDLLFLWALIQSLRDHLALPFLKLTIINHIPTSAGLGSSAALASAITQACFDWVDKPLTSSELFEWTQKSEKMVHGNPSGIDALMVQSTQPYWFAKGKQPKSIQTKMPGHFLIVDSGIQGKTKQAIQNVASLYMKNMAQVHLESIGLMVPLVEEALTQQDEADLGRLMNQTHYHLQEMNVSHPFVDEIVHQGLELGALGGKLTGGGLGGSILFYVPTIEIATKLMQHVQQRQLKVWMM